MTAATARTWETKQIRPQRKAPTSLSIIVSGGTFDCTTFQQTGVFIFESQAILKRLCERIGDIPARHSEVGILQEKEDLSMKTIAGVILFS